MNHWIAYLLLLLWGATFYPAGLFHHHDETHMEECHINCIPEEEAMDIHHECDHALHLHETTAKCFICEFTVQKVFLTHNVEFFEVQPLIVEYAISSELKAYETNYQSLAIRGPPVIQTQDHTILNI